MLFMPVHLVDLGLDQLEKEDTNSIITKKPLLHVIVSLFCTSSSSPALWSDAAFLTGIVCAAIHLGGKLRFYLPIAAVSSTTTPTTPVTLHTLAATVSGMIFGRNISVAGACFHAALWIAMHPHTGTCTGRSTTTTQKDRRDTARTGIDTTARTCNIKINIHRAVLRLGPSFGYVLGMIPCACVAALLGTPSKNTTTSTSTIRTLQPRYYNYWSMVPVAALAQTATLLCGVAWIFVWTRMNTHFATNHSTPITAVHTQAPKICLWEIVKQNALPFLPGLVVKSILAVVLVSVLSLPCARTSIHTCTGSTYT